MLGSKEHYDVMEQFQREFKHHRLDREKDKSLWRMGQVYEDGRVNELFGAYLRGYQLAKAIERLSSTQPEDTQA